MEPPLADEPEGPHTATRSGTGDVGAVAQGAVFRAVTLGVAAAIGLPATALLVRHLGQEGYGAVAFALAIVTFALRVTDLGVGTGVTRMVAFAGPPRDVVWGRLGARVAVASAAVGAAACVVPSLFLEGAARPAVAIGSLLVLIGTIKIALVGFLSGRRLVGLVERSRAVNQFLDHGAAIVAVLAGWATVARVMWLSVGAAVVALLLVLPTWRRLTADAPAPEEETLGRLLRLSLPLMAAHVAFIALQRSDVILLGIIRGTAEVGLYVPVLRLVEFSILGSMVVSSYFVPVATRLVSRQDLGGLKDLYIVVTKWQVILTFPLLMTLLLAPEPLLVLILGPRFAAGGPLASVLAVGYVLNVLGGNNALTLAALGRSREIAIRSAIAFVVNIAANVVLIGRFGAIGAATTTALVYVGHNIANSYLIWKIARVHPIRSDLLTVLGWTTAVAVVTFAVTRLVGVAGSLVAPIAIGAAVGAAGLVAGWCVATDEEAALFRRARWLGRRRSA